MCDRCVVRDAASGTLACRSRPGVSRRDAQTSTTFYYNLWLLNCECGYNNDKLPMTGNSLYQLSMVIWGRVYYCYTHITHPRTYVSIHRIAAMLHDSFLVRPAPGQAWGAPAAKTPAAAVKTSCLVSVNCW